MHAPKITRTITLRPHAPWFNEEIHHAKREKRKWERKWRKTRLEIHHEIYLSHCEHQGQLILAAKQSYYADRIAQCGRDTKAVFRISDRLLGRSKEISLPERTSDEDLANAFSDFFSNKIENIRRGIPVPQNNNANVQPESVFSGDPLESFAPTTEDEVTALIRRAPPKSCELDPIPTWLLKQSAPQLVPAITTIINTSLSTSTVPTTFKRAILRPLLKKQGLDTSEYKNFRPVSNLPFISKIMEKVVCKRIEAHMVANGLFDDLQSAYRSHASTETALIKVNNDILATLDKGQHAALIMLDLSAAFDTLDHDVFL